MDGKIQFLFWNINVYHVRVVYTFESSIILDLLVRHARFSNAELFVILIYIYMYLDETYWNRNTEFECNI